MAGFDRGVPMKQLHTLRPVTNAAFTEDPIVNAMGCSGHWFTQKDAKDGNVLVTAGWYEHGTRFLSVNPRTGAITQVGYYQPTRGATSQAYWMPGSDVVWSIDYHSGIDILQFDQAASKRPTAAKVESSWLARLDTDPLAQAVRELCQAGSKATPAQHAKAHAFHL